MNLKMLKATIIGFILSINAFANAGLITESDLLVQTIDGQNFNFSLNTPNYISGTSSLLKVIVQGDFNSAATFDEGIIVYIEGTNYGNYFFNSPEAYNIIDYTAGVANYNTFEFSLDFLLSPTLTNTYLLDNTLDIMIDFQSGVTATCGWSNVDNCSTSSGASPFAAVNYTYSQSVQTQVPEPSTLAIFALGIMGLASRRFKKN